MEPGKGSCKGLAFGISDEGSGFVVSIFGFPVAGLIYAFRA